MELRQVSYALGVVDHGGFTRAAEALHVAQPSLSQAVRALERELGTALFHRLGRQVTLTAAGEAFVSVARQLLRDAATLQDSVASVAGLQVGHLDLVSLPTLAAEPLAPLVGRFRRLHPGVTVRIVEPDTLAELAERVRSGRCEIGLSELPVPGAPLATVPLGTQEVVAVCPPGTAVGTGGTLRARDLATMPLVATPVGTSTRNLVDVALAAARVTPVLAVESGQRDAIVPLVLGGAGTCFLPRPLAERARRDGAVVASLDPALQRKIGFVHRNGPLSPAAEAFLGIVADMVKAVPPGPAEAGVRRSEASPSRRAKPGERSHRRA
jgi:DNA-binding transcriptional LysR family regulator